MGSDRKGGPIAKFLRLLFTMQISRHIIGIAKVADAAFNQRSRSKIFSLREGAMARLIFISIDTTDAVDFNDVCRLFENDNKMTVGGA